GNSRAGSIPAPGTKSSIILWGFFYALKARPLNVRNQISAFFHRRGAMSQFYGEIFFNQIVMIAFQQVNHSMNYDIFLRFL
ncbi:MAG TPA: hypothetical protein PLG86_06945, partial [Bacteroidales bacterium]|nr:hypothetical protein [Bacteroidales bacterium]